MVATDKTKKGSGGSSKGPAVAAGSETGLTPEKQAETSRPAPQGLAATPSPPILDQGLAEPSIAPVAPPGAGKGAEPAAATPAGTTEKPAEKALKVEPPKTAEPPKAVETRSARESKDTKQAKPGSPPPAAEAKPSSVLPPASPAATGSEPVPPAAAPAPAKPAPAAAAPKKEAARTPLSPSEIADEREIGAILAADHRDPFAFLGMHMVSGRPVVRVFVPQATAVAVIDGSSGRQIAELTRIREEGLFVGAIESASAPFAYRLGLSTALGPLETEDAYRFPPLLSEEDCELLAAGNHLMSYEKLGAHRLKIDGVSGVGFAVWAPNAGRVAVVGEFNGWDGRCHGMRLRHECGVWEIFIPGVRIGQLYKYEIKSNTGALLTDKGDPYAFAVEKAPGSASIVCDLDGHAWQDRAWMSKRQAIPPREQPISVYQVHLASWRRKPEDGHRCLTYRELAEELVGYLTDMGFTHLQLLPVGEFDFDASLGYQPFAPYAPTARWGTPGDFQYLVDRCHQAGVGVIVDWVPDHFSGDPHGLRDFDGTQLYEHPDPQRRHHPGSNNLIYDYGRREVSNYLISNALFWLDKYHLDGLRLPNVHSMLYLDYGRSRGEWTPNRFGGHENLEAIDFLRRLNEHVYGERPGVFTVGEDNSGWARFSHPTFLGGLGFGFKWNQEWVRDTLRYMSRNPVHRKYYHDELVHPAAKIFDENFVLPLSHHESGYGRGSLLRRIPGDRWQRFANLRAYYGLLYGHPGKKLLFMGDEFAQEREWNSEISLDWHVLDDPLHAGVRLLVRDLNLLYRSTPALHWGDCIPEGFAWIDCNDSDQGVLSFLRQGRDGQGTVAVICHLTPVARRNYRIGVPQPGFYRERLNTDAERYGGANIGNEGGLTTVAEPMHGRPYSLAVTLPPLSTVIFELEEERTAQP